MEIYNGIQEFHHLWRYCFDKRLLRSQLTLFQIPQLIINWKIIMNILSCVFVLLTGLSSAFTSAYLPCGEYGYNPYRQRCCGGRIHVTPDALETEFACCGDDLYPLDGTWQCCGNTKMDIRNDTVCCNGEIINSTTHECCGDLNPHTSASQQKHLRQEGHECCGTSYFNIETQTCCSSDDYSPLHVAEGIGSCCGTQTYDDLSEICCRLPSGGMQSHSIGRYGVMLEETECCGNGWINKTTHICCQNVPQIRGNVATSCYGTQTYNPTRQVICGGGLHDIQDGKTECCNGHLINPNDEPCCSDFALLRQSPFSCCGNGWTEERVPFDPTETSCFQHERINFPELIAPNRVWKKCGETVYADTLFICCDGQLSPKFEDSKCCGSDPFRDDTQFCINNMVVNKITPNAQLCTTDGREEDVQYDPETQTCCRETYYSSSWKVFNGTEGECCLVSETEVILTDPSTQTCCKAHEHQKVHETPLGEGICCGPEMLIPGSQLCDWAMQEVVEIPENHLTHNDICVPLNRVNNNIRQTYDNRREFCSNDGEIIPRADGKDICGGQIYDTETHSCCETTIYRLVTEQCCGNGFVQPLVNDEGLPLVCCDIRAYHPETSACRNGNVWKDIPDENARLCGSEVYDDSLYDCVNGWELVPQDADPHIRLCGQSRKVYDERLQECCGEELIGLGQTCCSGYVTETPGTALRGGSCCRNVGYNPSTHSCCIGTISLIQGMESPACCKHQAYDSSLSNVTCCGGRLNRRMPGETECSVTDGVVHRPDEMVCGGVRHPRGHMQCCGSDLYDPATELCCEGLRYEAEEGKVCCGNKPYNTATGDNLCCDGTIHTQATGKECCNRAAFYPSTHQCFTTGSQKVIIKHFDDAPSTATDAFCTEGSYDPTNQTCCDGLLYNGLRECCGNQVIAEPLKFMCCNSAIQRRLYGDASQCCPSGQIVHEASGCGIQGLSFGHQMCNGTEFFPLVQGCCAGVVYSFHNAQCRNDQVLNQCGRDFYSQDEQTCCNGSLKDVPNGECCEDAAFDPTSHICCEGNIRRIRRKRDQCCGSLAFDTKREMCCKVGPSRLAKKKRRKMKMVNKCCREGFQPNYDTGYCEEAPLLCQGLERRDLWKEAADDCSMDFTFSFKARRIDVNDTKTVIEIDSLHHLLPHNGNIDLDTVVLPATTWCRKLEEGETYVIFSSGDIEGNSLLIRNEDFLGRYIRSVAHRLLDRTCE